MNEDHVGNERHPYRSWEPEIEPRRPFSFMSAFALLMVAVLGGSMFAVSCEPIGRHLASSEYQRSGLIWLGALGIAVAGVVAFAVALRWLTTRDEDRPRGLELLQATLPAGFFSVVLAVVTYFLTQPPPPPSSFVMGRRLRSRRHLLLAPRALAGDGWLHVGEVASLDVSSEERVAVAAEWRRAGRNEHAAIAAFSHVALELMAVGAPAELVADAQRASLDEVRHARLCFSIARAIDGQVEGPAPFPEARVPRLAAASRTNALARLAVGSLLDGSLNEGVAGRVLARLSRTAHPSLREHLRAMAVDESRHAAHSWRVIEWCLKEGGAPVAQALAAARADMPLRMTGDVPSAAADGSWERWGVQGEALERAEWDATRRGALAKLAGLLGDRLAA